MRKLIIILLFVLHCNYYAYGAADVLRIKAKVLLFQPEKKCAIILFSDKRGFSKRLRVYLCEFFVRLHPGDIIKVEIVKSFDGIFVVKRLKIIERRDMTGIRERLLRGRWREFQESR